MAEDERRQENDIEESRLLRDYIIRRRLDGISSRTVQNEIYNYLKERHPTIPEDKLRDGIKEIIRRTWDDFKKRREKALKHYRSEIKRINDDYENGIISKEEAEELKKNLREEYWKMLGPGALKFWEKYKKYEDAKRKHEEEEKVRQQRLMETSAWKSIEAAEREKEISDNVREAFRKRAGELRNEHRAKLNILQKKHGRFGSIFKRLGESGRYIGERKKLSSERKEAIREAREKKYEEDVSKITDALKRKYSYKYDELQRQLSNGEITEEEYNQLSNKLDEEIRKKALRFVRGGRRKERIKSVGERMEKFPLFGKAWSKHVQKVTIMIAFVIGIVMSAFLHSIYFFLGFLFWSMYVLIPEAKPPKFEGKMVLTWRELVSKKYLNNVNAGSGLLRGVFKATSIMMFIWAIKTGTVPFQSIALIAVAFIGYYSFDGTYDPEVPSSIIQSLIRFGIGAFIIPFWVFYSIFNSLVLTFIALAFFAIPPMAKEGSRSESFIFANYFMFDKIWFAVLMLIALAGAGIIPGISSLFGGMNWGLTGTLKATFLYFWLITFVSGFFSSPSTRPVTGIFMLGSAVIIYGLGPGTQDVGSALFGPWFPTVYKAMNSIMKPVGDIFNQLGGTFGTAITLLVNPMGFAQQMMNGTYAGDSTTGLKGPLGVEIERMWATPIYPYQPYQIIMKIKNKGAFDAHNVTLSLYVNRKLAAREQTISLSKDKIVLGEIGFVSGEQDGVDLKCFDNNGDETSDPERIVRCTRPVDKGNTDLVKMDVRQIFFNSAGIECPVIQKYALRERTFAKKQAMQFIPVVGEVDYDYKISSTLGMEFISKDEWDRRVKEDEEFLTQQKKPATLTNAPVQLNIDSLEQPIREGTPFFIGLGISSAQTNGKIIDIYNLTLKIPPEIAKNLESCTISPDAKDDNNGILIWKTSGNFKNKDIVYCRFSALNFDELQTNGSTRTFLIKADADYRFEQTDSEILTIEFGGGCCPGAGCPAGLECDWKQGDQHTGNCVPKKAETKTEAIVPPNYCQKLYEANRLKCQNGAGECKSDDECESVYGAHADNPLICKAVSSLDKKICCYKDSTNEECIKAFETWFSNIYNKK